MSSSNPSPEGLELNKRSQKDFNDQREWVIQKQQYLADTTGHIHVVTETDSMHITWTDPIQMGTTAEMGK